MGFKNLTCVPTIVVIFEKFVAGLTFFNVFLWSLYTREFPQ